LCLKSRHHWANEFFASNFKRRRGIEELG
jgi:hypothetical protein